MISSEQVRQALHYLQASGDITDSRCSADPFPEVSEALLEQIRFSLESVPDTRQDRVDHARAMLDGPSPSSSELAEKIIGRLLSDALR